MKNLKGEKQKVWIQLLFLMFVIVAVSALLPPSLGKIKQFKDEANNVIIGSIAEKTFVEINGVKQGMIIKGKDITKPVLLLVHGGPGMSDYFLSEKYPTNLEDTFVVCYWEQRGTGLSFSPDIPVNTMNTEQFVSDIIEVTNYLRNRFKQEKIYLMGHSWGTYISIKTVAFKPELYNAYIAMSQIVNQPESERLAYTYMLNQYKNIKDKNMIKNLEKYPICESDEALKNYLSSSLRDKAMHELGVGTMHNMKFVISGILLPSLRCTEYSPIERINIWRGKVFSSKTGLREEEYAFNAIKDIPELKIPVYFFAGEFDYTCCYSLQQDYFRKLKAPLKGFYSFKKSAHSPLFEEPDKAKDIFINDVINGKVTIADEL